MRPRGLFDGTPGAGAGHHVITARASSEIGETILIVDDHDAVRDTFAQILKFEGYRVRTFSDPESGLRAVAESRPHAIILDFRMPLLDGLAFLRRLRAIDERQEIPVAMVTGDYFLEDHVLAELKVLGAVLQFKPLWLEDLISLVHKLLRDAAHRTSTRVAASTQRLAPRARKC
jgi:DNA-binding response OmpR family regulator